MAACWGAFTQSVSLFKKLRFTGLALLAFLVTTLVVNAQSYTFNTVQIEGNQRVEQGTILTYAGIARGERVSAGRLNDAYQNILESGLFESVELEPRGSTLIIRVREFPTINRISIEGNRRIKDEAILGLLQSRPRRVYSPTVAERDAALITQAYAQAGRFAATVTPSIIRRSDNRVDLVFDISESGVIEIERISFTGNRDYSDRRLRRVLETKQAGIFRQLIGRDTFVEDRIEFDKQVLRDFYLSRGYVDFQTLNVSSELTRERDAFLITFNVREGQQFKFGQVRAVSLIDNVDEEDFQDVINIRPGVTYSPTAIETVITRMERLALQKGLNFVRVQPNVSRNDRQQTLDINFEITRGPRVFVERIDIEGNTTTLDRVIRRQFRIVEGDPFNPREIRQSAERIRALGLFANAEANVREGSSPDTVIIDVDVEEQNTGSLNFGANFNANDGIGLAVGFRERNFLGRGQSLSFGFNTSADNASYNFGFAEPAFLGRDLRFGIDLRYATTDGRFSDYATTLARFSPSLSFPVSENGRLSVRYALQQDEISDVEDDSSQLVIQDGDAGALITSSVGYSYTFDNRVTGLNPNAGILLRFSQDIAGLGGDREYLRTVAFLGAQTAVLNEEVTLRAIFEGGAINTFDGNSRITDRFSGNGKIRGFEPNGYGPRDLNAENEDAVYGNIFAAARFEADFPLPLPEEYGISGGAFFDIGSVWDLDDDLGGTIDDDLILRSSVGLSFLWTTPLGPLRFNFAQPLSIEDYDNPQYFDLSISTSF
ncbi:outer membrane protein assembly factor BamA [Parasulfitobacter algicola]|uniref:Outer membrane protein assembly factor BamA n=1 Tax=Parasulfitobacter algicola TaxID=2614809 RepID=A0ABX2IR56_9RHOB|nr:outer membrane protein assembly factor BamA [Sulfitobacter algicola]NSX55377.1 outer membrane protein assembly factor BamA [Sulfitobacter algicola]